ncbi:uncharacterized protein LOC111062306 isoform X2 [Nilaparvata lugens]|nr:uncharacterized protein LOC111062306 isoform X2 [Nilaparvata lugens]XP_039284085.1 uncharacterized protein LOC111062306 isoform X2 [Nilaparvata lugens]
MTSDASQQLIKLKGLINFLKDEAAIEQKDIEEGILHLSIADVKITLMDKVEQLRDTKPQCVKGTEAEANGIVSEVGNYVNECFAKIYKKLNDASELIENAKTTNDVDDLVRAVQRFYVNKKSHFEKCTKAAAKVMIQRMQREEEKIENCVKGVDSTPTVTAPDESKPGLTKPEDNKQPDSIPKYPSTTINIYYIPHQPKGCGQRKRPRKHKPAPVLLTVPYYWWW